MDAVCSWLAKGKSMLWSCKHVGVDPKTVYKWIRTDPVYATAYQNAKEDAADQLADEIIELSDTALDLDENGKIDSGRVNQLRLQVDARKWVAAKLKPKRYGERLTTEHTGPGGQSIMVITGVPLTLDTAPPLAIAAPKPMLIDVECTVRDDSPRGL